MRVTATVFLLIFSSFSQATEIQKLVLKNTAQIAASHTAPNVPAAGSSACEVMAQGTCFKHVNAFQPIILRDEGHWMEDRRTNKILESMRAKLMDLNGYPHFEVRTIAFDGNSRVAAEEVYQYGPDTQEEFIFAEIRVRNGKPAVEVFAYADMNDQAESQRTKTKKLENLFNSDRDFRSVQWQVHSDDTRRAESIQPVLQFLIDSGLLKGFVLSPTAER